MASSPPHVTSRPLKPRRSDRNPEIRSNAGLQSHDCVYPSALSQVEGYCPDCSRRGPSQLARPQARSRFEASNQKLDDTDFIMGGLEQALAAMRRDADVYEANEILDEFQRQNVRRDSGFVDTTAIDQPAASNKKRKGAISRDAKQPLQSLAATHPSLYPHPLTKPDQRAPALLDLDSAPGVMRAGASSEHSQPLAKPWQIFSSPIEAKHPSPTHDNSRIARRERDLDSQDANVISPVRMVALPLGESIEVARDYEAGINDDEYVAPSYDWTLWATL